MIGDEMQDSAALYVLGGLQGAELDAFEASLRSDTELRELVADLREAAGAMAHAAPARQPSNALRQRVLSQIAVEKTSHLSGPASDRRSSSAAWAWAIAALLMIFCGYLAYDGMNLRREMAEVRNSNPLANARLVALAPANGAPAQARATVAWEPDRQTGVIQITGLPAAAAGKDYQLWVVDADHKDPVNGGIVHIDSNGVAQVSFKPDAEARHVKAFALSLERTGGVPKAEGPILLVGSTT